MNMFGGPSVQIHDDDSDETVSIDANDSHSPFQIPMIGAPRMSGAGMGGGENANMGMLINRAKVSKDVLSASSGAGSVISGGGSEYSESEAGTEESAGGGGGYGGAAYGAGAGNGGGAGGYGGVPATGLGGGALKFPAAPVDNIANRMAMERSRVESEMNEKKEILYQMDRLEAKGYNLPKQFSMQSDLEEMRHEYNRILREKEVDASVRFQRKMMMAFVTGVEFLNTRFDPLDVKLDGWSEQVHENINDYDDIFEELHEKYKSTGKKMAPELRLLMSLSGSAFMFHLTNSMFKKTAVPGVEQVLRNNPDLMRQFQQAAAQQMGDIGRAAGAMNGGGGQGGGGGGQGGGMFGGGGLMGMMGNMFGMNSAGASAGPAPVFQQRTTMPSPTAASAGATAAAATRKMNGPSMFDIDDVINDVQMEMTGAPKRAPGGGGGGAAAAAGARMERMSMSDEDITSLIESEIDGVMSERRSVTSRGTAGGGAPRRGRPPGAGKRVLDI